MLNNSSSTVKTALAGVGALALFSLAPLGASAHSINLEFDDHRDLLERVIELDAEGIADLQRDLAEARADIADAIADIEDAQEEIRETRLGGAVARIAFRAASVTVSKVSDNALDEVRAEITKAESELESRRNELGAAEYNETRGAFAMIRSEISELERALADLTAALRDV